MKKVNRLRMECILVKYLFLLLICLSMGCGVKLAPIAPSRAPSLQVSRLPFDFVAPESCDRARGGWVVSDQGCGFEQQCQEETSSSRGKIIQVNDDGSSKTLLSGLNRPTGVKVSSDGIVWVVVKGAHAVIALTPDGHQFKLEIDGAKYLNGVLPLPGRSALVSDSISGKIRKITLEAKGMVMEDAYFLPDAPNGLAYWNGGVAVATTGNMKVPGNPGAVHIVASTSSYQLESPADVKFDDIAKVSGGYLVSSIWRVSTNKQDNKLWFIRKNHAPKLAFDGSKYGLVSAAGIGVDTATGDFCVTDLNGSKRLKKPGAGEAKVLIVSNWSSK